MDSKRGETILHYWKRQDTTNPYLRPLAHVASRYSWNVILLKERRPALPLSRRGFGLVPWSIVCRDAAEADHAKGIDGGPANADFKRYADNLDKMNCISSFSQHYVIPFHICRLTAPNSP